MSLILFAGGIVILFFALAQLAAPQKKPIHFLMLGACVFIDYVVLYAWAADSGRLPPLLLDTDLIAAAFYAPFLYLAALTILREGEKPVRRYYPFFAAPAPFAVAVAALNWRAAAAGSLGPLAASGYFSTGLRTALRIGVAALVAAAIASALFAAYRLRKGGKVAKPGSFRHQVVFLSIYQAVSLTALAAAILRNADLFEAALAALCPSVLAFALTRTDVRFFPVDAAAPARPKAARPEWDAGDAELGARLDKLMRDAAPYRRANLSIDALARMAGVESKRLSYHFNARHGTNFCGYVNSWRLEAIRGELLKRPDRSILEIAFDNGFNSKSSFNALFAKAYGTTPSQYRKSHSED